jgi:hypothetical protein
VTPYGLRNVAAEPTPLAFPKAVPLALPPPASDVTTVVAMLTTRMRLLRKSATYKNASAALSAILTGRLKSAFVPVPS